MVNGVVCGGGTRTVVLPNMHIITFLIRLCRLHLGALAFWTLKRICSGVGIVQIHLELGFILLDDSKISRRSVTLHCIAPKSAQQGPTVENTAPWFHFTVRGRGTIHTTVIPEV